VKDIKARIVELEKLLNQDVIHHQYTNEHVNKLQHKVDTHMMKYKKELDELELKLEKKYAELSKNISDNHTFRVAAMSILQFFTKAIVVIGGVLGIIKLIEGR